MIRGGQADQLDRWLERAEGSLTAEFQRFAASLCSDYAAVKAALAFPWSSGQTEGQINRLKLI